MSNINISPIGHCSPRPLYDVAVIDVSLNDINLVTDLSSHLVKLDNIDISSNIFHSIFYDSSGDFHLNPNYINLDLIKPYVGINNPYRTYNNGSYFSLVDLIFSHIEYDLNVCRTAFTPCTNIALNRKLVPLTTFYDLGVLELACSIDWNSIVKLVNDYIGTFPSIPPAVYVDLVITIIFKTPTVGVLPTILKLIYTTEFKVNQYPLLPDSV